MWRFIIIATIISVWGYEFGKRKINYGLDLKGGTEFVIGFDQNAIPKGKTVEEVRDQILEILRNRVDSEGLREPELKETGDTSISLKMPSTLEADKADIRALIKQTAKLTFHLVHDDNESLAADYQADPEKFKAPLGWEVKFEKTDDPKAAKRAFIVKTRPEPVKGEQLDRAIATTGQSGIGYMVSLRFNTEGARKFGDVTSKYTNKRLAIVLDGQVYSAPNIEGAIYGGSAQITGNFNIKEAKRLANVLNSGNLPVSINIDSEFGTDPTLGADSVASGTNAAFWGLAGVFVFMMVYYMVSGVIASTALAANILLIMGTLAIFGATLTLPGIAGIVLTIGMAVDANVIIFERIREEFIKGKSIANAIHYGFDRAFVTILDANLTTLLTAYILYKVGTGSIKGFAVTLSIGILASMFTALFMTRAMFDLLLRKGLIKELKMIQLFKRPNIDFLSKRKVAAIISGAFIVLGLIATVVYGRNALSVDFTGGSQITFHKSQDVELASQDIVAIFDKAEYANTRADIKDNGKMLSVTFPATIAEIDDNAFPVKVAEILTKAAPEAEFKLMGTNKIGSLIGKQFQGKAIWAMILAVIGIIIYISFRFEFKFAIAANIALVHDVLIATGIYIMCGRQISLPVIAALLTIIGYSLNDTIVVFDRIREDLGLIKDKSYSEIINLSINQTLSRTVLTSFTTLIVVLILFVFGGGAINDFALVMMLGVIIGTYSSIFVASSVVSIWHDKEEQKAKEIPATKEVEA